LVGGENESVLDCYRLARWYHVNPEVFLSMPLSRIAEHLSRTDQLAAAQQPVSDE
jgi:hypothetical protein